MKTILSVLQVSLVVTLLVILATWQTDDIKKG